MTTTFRSTRRLPVLFLSASLGALTCLLLSAGAAAASDAPDLLPPVPMDTPRRGFEAPPHRYAAGHRGVDLRAPAGTAVRSASTGKVSFVGKVAGRPVVVVRSGEFSLSYEPVTASVTKGQPVVAGSVLGRLASSGSHCAPQPCLHWGVRRSGSYVDPLAFVVGSRPRLLPWDRAFRPASPDSPMGTRTGGRSGSTPDRTSAVALPRTSSNRPAPTPSPAPRLPEPVPASPAAEDGMAHEASDGRPLALGATAAGLLIAGGWLSRPVR